MGLYLCPRCLTVLSQVPDIGKDCDRNRRQVLRDYAQDAPCVEASRRIIFDLGMSVGRELEILKHGSLVLTRVIGFSRSLLLLLIHSRMPITLSLAKIQQSSCQLTPSMIGTLALEGVCTHTTFKFFMYLVGK